MASEITVASGLHGAAMDPDGYYQQPYGRGYDDGIESEEGEVGTIFVYKTT